MDSTRLAGVLFLASLSGLGSEPFKEIKSDVGSIKKEVDLSGYWEATELHFAKI